MHVPIRMPLRGQRFIVGALLVFALFFNTVGTLFAGTTGTINGSVTDTKTHLPIANVKVAASSPTANYAGTTDAKGFFSFTGVSPDTYTVSFESSGFQSYSLTGITVFADGVASLTPTLDKSLATIGRVTARSQGGAYQPKQTVDTYTVTDKQITTQLGKKNATSESQLIFTLPGASKDSSGYPVIRGGRENEEGFQYEGIPFTDAFTNQFINSLALNGGTASLQLTPGAGDAATGNNGTGTLNLLSKRGTNPGFGSLDFETLVYPYAHQFAFDYGFASPNGRISNYFAYTGNRSASFYGTPNADATSLNRFYSRQFQTGDDLQDNFVFKFGRDNNQSLQLFYTQQNFHFINNGGGIDGLKFRTADPFALANFRGLTGLSTSTVTSVIGLDKYQTDPNQSLNRASSGTQPNEAFKIQYSNNIDSSTFLTAKFYKVNSVVTFDQPYNNAGFRYLNALQGGLSNGVTLDVTKQINAKNLLKVGGSYGFLHPVFNFDDPSLGYLSVAGFGNGYEIADFLSPANADCNVTLPNDPRVGTRARTNCGYLQSYFSNGVPRSPTYLETTGTNRQDFAAYLNDTISPSDRLKIDVGARIDGANYQLASEAPCNAYSAAGVSLDTRNNCFYAYNGFDAKKNPTVTIDNKAKHPVIFEPRLAVSFQVTKNDALRASYGRSVEFAPLGDIDNVVSRGEYSRFAGIPSYNNFLDSKGNPIGGNAMICGVTGDRACIDYQDQLFWEQQNAIGGVPLQPVKPETFTNIDFSISHQFGGNVSAKVTPFYRRGYDALALTQTPRLDAKGVAVVDANGNVQYNPASATNLGINRTTGVEFLLTKEADYGLSGSLSATYINELTNVPPLSASEDFFPTIPPASLALGNVYRVGFLSPFQSTLAVQYKSKGGLRINPVISYNRGYPLGAGTLTSRFVNGVAVNLPNTNLTNPSGSRGTQQYVDPQNPGAFLKPNIAAIRGGALGPSAGSALSLANINTNLTVEFSKPASRSTIGVLVTNLFGNVYGGPLLNSFYQPVASGVAGPKTGTNPNGVAFPGIGIQTYYGDASRGNQAFINRPNLTPATFRLYYQLGL